MNSYVNDIEEYAESFLSDARDYDRILRHSGIDHKEYSQLVCRLIAVLGDVCVMERRKHYEELNKQQEASQSLLDETRYLDSDEEQYSDWQRDRG